MQVRRIVNRVFSSNTFVLRDGGIAYLVDCGDVQEVSNLCEECVVKAVFLTHTHFDHIYGIEGVISRFPYCLVYTSGFGMRALASSKLNFSRYQECVSLIELTSPNLRVIREADKVLLFDNVVMKVMETPGHDKSCLSYQAEDYLFTGDSFIPGVKMVTNLPGSDKETSEASLEKIRACITENTIICPGHGGMVKGKSIQR